MSQYGYVIFYVDTKLFEPDISEAFKNHFLKKIVKEAQCVEMSEILGIQVMGTSQSTPVSRRAKNQ